MKDFVSSRWTSVVALVASMSVVCAIFVPHGVPWTGLAWASMALCALSTRVEAELMLAVALPGRATPMGVAPLRLMGGRTL